MNSFDRQLTEQLHELAGAESESAPPMRQLMERGRRARHRRAVLMTGTSFAVVAIGAAVAVVAGVGGPPAPDARPPAASAGAAQSPKLKLVAAVAASENLSYRMRLTVTADSGKVLQTYEGAFDPKTRTGYVRNPQDDSVMTELLIDGTRYVGGEPPLQPLPPDKGPGETYGRYGQYPGKYDRLMLISEGAGGVVGAASPDPAALFKALKAADATVTEQPDGSVKYAYSTKFPDGSSTTSGVVSFDADGRIATVTMTFTWESTAKGRLDTGTSHATLELSDYGLTVTVKRPTDVVPHR